MAGLCFGRSGHDGAGRLQDVVGRANIASATRTVAPVKTLAGALVGPAGPVGIRSQVQFSSPATPGARKHVLLAGWPLRPGPPSAACTIRGDRARSRSPGNRATAPPPGPHATATSRSGATSWAVRRPGGRRCTGRNGSSSVTGKIVTVRWRVWSRSCPSPEAPGTWHSRCRCSSPDAGARGGPDPSSRPAGDRSAHRDRAR